MPRDIQKKHPSHEAELKKLNRIAGQIEGVKRMIDDHRYCPEIIAQLRAVRAAVKRVEADILETHLHSCVVDALKGDSVKDAEQKINELTDLFRRYDDA